MTYLRICAFALSVSLLAASHSQAAETGFYVGGFYGTADKDDTQAGFDAFADSVYGALAYTPATFTNTFDAKSRGYGFVGGYRLFQNLAVEAGFMDLGKVVYRERTSGSLSDGTNTLATDAVTNVDSKVGGISVSALGILPISYNAEVYARGGLMFSSHKYHFFYGDSVGAIEDEYTESDTDFLAGIGASYTLAEVYALRAEFIRVFDAGDKEFGEGDVDMLTLGVTVRF